MNALLSVDPGSRSSGWAYWLRSDEWRLVGYGRLIRPDVLTIWDFLVRLSPEWTDSQVVVEGQWMAPRGVGFDAVQKIVESRCAWTSCAMILGAPVAIVPPRTWIAAMTTEPWKKPKARILDEARRRWPESRIVEDEADALLLGEYQLGAVSRDDAPKKGIRIK